MSESINGVEYTADDSDVGAGATVTDFDSSTTTVDIPDTVELGGTDYDVVEIADNAFEDESLTSAVIGDNVTTIGEKAFYNNDLENLVLPHSVTTVGGRAFSLNHLTSLTLSNSLDSMGKFAFSNNNLVSVTVPDSVTEIPQSAFWSNDLESVTLPDGLTTISLYAFQYNDLTTLDLPNSVTSIGARSFHGNDLTSVTLPSSLTSIQDGAFGANTGLTSVTFTGPAPTVGGSASDSDPSFDITSDVVLTYPWRYGDPQTPGGYTTTPWKGYNTQAIATVDFDLNGQGSTTPDAQDVPVDEQATEPAEPTASGYEFTGWYTDADDVFDFSTEIDGDTTLYAGWEEAVPPPTDDVTVAKTVDASFVRVYDWELNKTGEVGDVTVGDDAASAEVDYTVTATPGDYRDDHYMLSGEITVTHEILEPMDVTVTDTLEVGTEATCEVLTADGEPAEEVTIGAGDTDTFDYTCELDGTPQDGTNTATVTWGDSETTVTEDVVFDQRDTSFDTVTVVDDQTTPDDGWVELGEADWNADGIPTDFSYTLTHDELAIGECTSLTNTAMITQTEQTTDATVEICPEAAPGPTPTPTPPSTPGTPDAGSDPSLPQTGIDMNAATAAALLLTVTGAAAMALRRRQQN